MVGSEVPLLEMQDVICLLKDKKVLYIQKDHLSARLDICRLVQCVCVMERVPIIHSSYDVYMRNIVNDMSACMITEHDPGFSHSANLTVSLEKTIL